MVVVVVWWCVWAVVVEGGRGVLSWSTTEAGNPCRTGAAGARAAGGGEGLAGWRHLVMCVDRGLDRGDEYSHPTPPTPHHHHHHAAPCSMLLHDAPLK